MCSLVTLSRLACSALALILTRRLDFVFDASYCGFLEQCGRVKPTVAATVCICRCRSSPTSDSETMGNPQAANKR